MSTRQPRVVCSFSDKTHATLGKMAAYLGKSKAAVVRDLLDSMQPELEEIYGKAKPLRVAVKLARGV